MSWDDVRPIVEASVVRIEDIEEVAETTFHPNLDRDKITQHPVSDGWDLSRGGSNLEENVSVRIPQYEILPRYSLRATFIK